MTNLKNTTGMAAFSKAIQLILLLACSSCAFLPSSKPHELTGYFHRPNHGDAYSLAIFPDGHFRWHLDGCDYGRGGYGQWRREGDTLILYGKDNQTFDWSNGKITWGTHQVIVSPHGTGILTSGLNKNDKLMFWQRGLVCAQCEGALLGPRGPAVACSPEKEEQKKQWLQKRPPT